MVPLCAKYCVSAAPHLEVSTKTADKKIYVGSDANDLICTLYRYRYVSRYTRCYHATKYGTCSRHSIRSGSDFRERLVKPFKIFIFGDGHSNIFRYTRTCQGVLQRLNRRGLPWKCGITEFILRKSLEFCLCSQLIHSYSHLPSNNAITRFITSTGTLYITPASPSYTCREAFLYASPYVPPFLPPFFRVVSHYTHHLLPLKARLLSTHADLPQQVS